MAELETLDLGHCPGSIVPYKLFDCLLGLIFF
jgi:hypothetical protein